MEEIDIIELLRRVKEGTAPKIIEIGTTQYILEKDMGDYFRTAYDTTTRVSLLADYTLVDITNIKITILDKPVIEEKKTQIDKLLEYMTDYGITSYNGLNFAEIRKEIIELRKELSKKDKIINLMATELSMFSAYNSNPKHIIEKFYKEVEEENANNKN